MSNLGNPAATLAGVPGPGEVLAGKFRVEQVLGAGGMGVVVAAHHLHLDQRVALKFLLPAMLSQPIVVERFLREARSAAQIRSEHVARVLDVGTLPTGAPYLVMEYLDGHDLAAELRSQGPLPTAQAVDWLLEAGEAVAEAHAAGIVHRDLKPANLFLARHADGKSSVKVVDFGISKQRLLDDTAQSHARPLTQTATQLGSPAYMPPEQLRSAKDVDERADIWALGMILYELLTGKIAFTAPTLPELHVAILTEPPAPLRTRRADVPVQLETVVMRCLEKEPAARFRTVAQLAVSLAPFGSPSAQASADRIGRVLGGSASGPAGPTEMAPSEIDPAGPPGAAASGIRSASSPTPHGAQPRVAPTMSDASHHGAFGQVPTAGQGPAALAMPPVAPGPHHHGAAPLGHGPTYPSAAGHPPMGAHYAARPAPQGTSTALILLVVLVCMLVLGSGGCVMCMCIGAAGNAQQQNQSR